MPACVSSLMCAEASKPVIVYWAISRPGQEHVEEHELPKFVPEKPVLFSVWPKT